VVILHQAIYYLAQPDRFLDECHRVLRKKGNLLICTNNKEWLDLTRMLQLRQQRLPHEVNCNIRVYVMDASFLILFLGGFRLTPRLFREFGMGRRGRRVLIFGAGNAGEMIVRDMKNNPFYDSKPIGFVDDDATKAGQRSMECGCCDAESHRRS
jgi:FlaA1/EpsC-like NDP-sugar epimerase